MFEKLSVSQLVIVNCDAPRIVVKACPGSGKTFSVTARLAKLINEKTLGSHQGIAALSFTNTACDEIRKGLKSEYGISEIQYPNYVGTIDSFVNNYIFLPYGHLLMGCKQRPEIVGTEYNRWFDYNANIRNFDRTKIIDPNYYFDKVSFDINDNPMPLVPAAVFNFSWKKMRNTDGRFRKDVIDIIESKKVHFSKGKANQADANYFAYKILINHPLIAQNIVKRFPILIIDEAQDTTAIQMAIIDILDRLRMQSIMLIGDPDQAIFEWNTADPSLFMEKYDSERWHSLNLTENRRSSTNICGVINQFFGGNMQSVSRERDCVEVPLLKKHQTDKESICSIVEEFKIKCQELELLENAYAIVYRGRSFGERYFNLQNESQSHDNSMWINGKYYVRDIVQGKYLIDNRAYKQGIHLLEKGLLKMQHNLKYVSQRLIKEQVTESGFRLYRKNLHDFVNILPQTNQSIKKWIDLSNKLGFQFEVNNSVADINISNIFYEDKICNQPTYYRTIHSVKGMSLDAILVFLTKRDHSNYSTIIPKDYNLLDIDNKEQIRIVYVACSRPKKLLWIAVPSEDINCWKAKLSL